jgi:hypothetical protein
MMDAALVTKPVAIARLCNYRRDARLQENVKEWHF